MDNNENTQNEGKNNVTEGNENQKTFTEEDVNRIVQARLAKRDKKDSEELDRRAAELDARERLINAREELRNNSMPEYLSELLNTTSDEKMKAGIELLKKWKGETDTAAGEGNPSANGVPVGTYNPIGVVSKGDNRDTLLRGAFGL